MSSSSAATALGNAVVRQVTDLVATDVIPKVAARHDLDPAHLTTVFMAEIERNLALAPPVAPPFQYHPGPQRVRLQGSHRLCKRPDGCRVYITGTKVGDIGATSVSETVAGGDNATVYSTIYFSSVDSVVINANTSANVSVGYGGDLALPRCRIKGLYYVAGSSAGTVTITPESSTIPILEMATPANNTVVSSLYMAAEGILTASTKDDYAVVSNTNVTSVTLICG